jgi:hypothetical protein
VLLLPVLISRTHTQSHGLRQAPSQQAALPS